MKLGFLYAGQGSQHPGMGADLYEAFPAFRAVLDSAEVDFDLKEVSFRDSQGVLNQTRYTQPCMVAFAAGLTAVLREKGIVPAAAAGLSLGEYSALHAAEVFDAVTAVELVAFRGKAMEAAAAGRESAMMAVLGLDREPLQAACDTASALGCVVIANYNCPGQLVIGGEKAVVERAAALAKEAGARRCLPLKGSGPFHTPLMAPAGDALAERFNGCRLGGSCKCGKGERQMNFAGKTAVVTGGSRGLGRAVCLELAAGGANVVLCYAGNENAAKETVAACEALGAKAVAVRCNVADSGEVKALMDAAIQAFGRIDILVNNAGITRDGLLMKMKEADFDAVIDTNLKGTFLCMKAVSRQMMKRRYGRIVIRS